MAKNRINLYPPELRPKKLHLSLNQIAQILLLSLLLLCALTGYSYWRYSSVTSELNTLKKEQDAQQKQISGLKTRLARHTPTPALQKQIADLEQQLHLNKILQEQLGTLQLKGSSGYADVLLDLARTDMRNLWLTSISFDGEQMNLKGKATSADALPAWLMQFKQFSSLNGRQFKTVQLQRSDDLLEFTLTSTQPSLERQ